MSAYEGGTTASNRCFPMPVTIAAFREPIEMISLEITQSLVLRNRQVKHSLVENLKSGSNSSNASLGLRILPCSWVMES